MAASSRQTACKTSFSHSAECENDCLLVDAITCDPRIDHLLLKHYARSVPDSISKIHFCSNDGISGCKPLIARRRCVSIASSRFTVFAIRREAFPQRGMPRLRKSRISPRKRFLRWSPKNQISNSTTRAVWIFPLAVNNDITSLCNR